ncbi:NAD+ synthase [Rhodohalobacter sp. SW132]|uniref:NAD+ synthase n=1 Tax=Rhodohalobacter sp. SW132 TaxID=2293433 RepID=UPI000E2246CC|nr:NAD+ synthase [Rhodohalobacter sp. SW132]REL33369.1 NAD+ synthase [Rhodohalobacter sp. SW132]
MKIRLHQLNPTIGDLEGNKKLILKAYAKAADDGIDLLILPEMVTTGYPVQDLLERPVFRDSVYSLNRELIETTKEFRTGLLFGSMTPNLSGLGRKMYNSAILAAEGEKKGVVHKSLLPTYDVFDDLRYFEPNRSFDCLELNGVKLGVTICEDIWYNENEVQYHTYEIDPARRLRDAGAELIINISASPFTQTKHENRLHMLGKHAKELNCPVLYCNQVGSHTEIVFEGDSMALNPDGKPVVSTVAFEESYADVEFTGGESLRGVDKGGYPKTPEERFFKAIKLGLGDYLSKTGVTDKVLLGLSGGIDSALVAVLAAETVGPENVTAITMPGEFSSEGSVSDSQKLADALGFSLYEIPINTIYDQFNGQLQPLFKNEPFGVAEENLQSRIRGTLLMTYSNKFNAFLLATGNKSEYAVGYATLYGDMNGAIAPIGDLYKTEIYKLAEWLNRSYYKREVIPQEIITKPPSAELRPDQKDSDSLPDYDTLDSILYQYIELQRSVGEISDSGIDPGTVKKIISIIDRQEFKRFQAAPIIKLTSKAFGTGRRRPLVQQWTSQEMDKGEK